MNLLNGDSLPTSVAEEFEHQSVQSRALFLVEHNEDGTHRASPEVTNFVPPGALMPYAGATSPANWLLCDGSQVNRLSYKRLFDIIGTTYGVGDGTTTFNLPDLRGVFPLGKAAAGTGSALGSTGGALDHTHSMGSHTHSISSQAAHSHVINDDGEHTHGITFTTTGPSAAIDVDRNLDASFVAVATYTHTHTEDSSVASNAGEHDHGGTTASAGSHDHGGTTGSAGAGTSGAANPPFLALNYIIKT